MPCETTEPTVISFIDEDLPARFGHLGHFRDPLVGSSRALEIVRAQIEKVAPTDATVLIQGETGTGKELVAEAIHRLSPRRGRLVTVNCASIPGELLESELFGYERGAFTGAVASKPGRLQLADRGTLFLDEIGDLPHVLQPKLLRVLQAQQFERLGGTRPVQIDARVVAATNQDLRQMIADRRFRSDLYYRLNVFPIRVPPLRERVEDIPELVTYFLMKAAMRTNTPVKSVPPYVLDSLMSYDWPGNVRELEHVVERAVILSPGPVLDPQLDELGSDRRLTDGAGPSGVAVRAQIEEALEASRWIVGGPHGAAARLGLKRTTLLSRMRRLGIRRPGRRTAAPALW